MVEKHRRGGKAIPGMAQTVCETAGWRPVSLGEIPA